MRVNRLSNINFQKKLVAKCGIVQYKHPRSAKIYQLEKKVDDKYLKRAAKMQSWKNENFYLNSVARNFKLYGDINSYKFYVLEDKNDNPLTYCQIYDNIDGSECLIFIETAPDSSIYNPKRTTKYAGESMLAFLAAQCKKLGHNLQVVSVSDRKPTNDFYFKNCKFDKFKEHDAIMTQDKIDEFLLHNKNHTGREIELVI